MWARSEAGLSRLPVTEKIAGSNPVGPAKILFTNTTKCGIIFLFLSLRENTRTYSGGMMQCIYQFDLLNPKDADERCSNSSEGETQFCSVHLGRVCAVRNCENQAVLSGWEFGSSYYEFQLCDIHRDHPTHRGAF